jgi:general secretion pathway protein D
MLVAPEISTLSGETVTVTAGVEVPIIAKRAAETACIVPDGMTVVIGGLMEDNETELVRKLPILGSIPWIGTLFRRTISQKAKTELLIFLTPYVVETRNSLQTLAEAETQNARLVPTAFTPDELEQHLDNNERLVRQPEEKPRKHWLKRASSWFWTELQIFK